MSSTQMHLPGVDAAFPAFPAVAQVIHSAATVDDAFLDDDPFDRITSGDPLAVLYVGLQEAWRTCRTLAYNQYPDDDERRLPGNPAHWVETTGGDIRRIALLPPRAQKLLSMLVTKSLQGDVERQLQGKLAADQAGWPERIRAYATARSGRAMDIYKSQPWQDDGELHCDNAVWLVSLFVHMRWDLPPTLVPKRDCPGSCPHTGADELERLDTADAQALSRLDAGDKVDHVIRSCPNNGGVRTSVHDRLMGIWVQLLKSAGFVDVRMEARDFDAGATSADKDHRRPDIVCNFGGVRYIIDLTIAWASAAGAVEWRHVGWDADQRAKAKRKSYEEAMERERQGQAGWFPELRLQSTDQFVPLAYEMNGTWGADADKFFRFVVECAGNEGTRAAELYHWSAMTFGEHWRRLVAVELGRGRVLCLRRAADRGYGGNTVPSAETAPDSL